MERIGQQLGNYRLIQYLGAGGFAEVYLGQHLYLHTLAAIKLLHTQLAEKEVEQFYEEARTIAHLDHPNIVRVLDFGVDRKTPFLVMAFAPNGTLQQRHPPGELVPLSIVISYVNQVASALQYAHDLRLIHRDVKPANMLIGQRGEILLSDFGLAMVAQTSLYEGEKSMAGTVAFMSPEQIRARPHRASDQYALGVVVYRWLCGDLPFRGTFFEVASQHCLAQPPLLREKLPTISPAVEAVIMKALEKEPQQRFESVQAFAAALEQASNSILTSKGAYTSLPLKLQGDAQGNPQLQTSKGDYTPLPSMQPDVPASTERKGMPRRAVLIGLALTGLAAAGGATTWLVRNNGQPPENTPTPTVSSGQEVVLYQADWSNGLNGWGASSDWKVGNGVLLNDGTGATDFIPNVPARTLPTILVPYDLRAIPDYAVEAKIQILSQGHDPGFAFFLRYTPDNNQGYIGGASTLERSSTHIIGFRIAPIFDWLDSIKIADFNPGASEHVYRIELRGNNMKVFIDGGLLLDAFDNRYPSGDKVGLWDKHVRLSISSLKIIKL